MPGISSKGNGVADSLTSVAGVVSRVVVVVKRKKWKIFEKQLKRMRKIEILWCVHPCVRIPSNV